MSSRSARLCRRLPLPKVRFVGSGDRPQLVERLEHALHWRDPDGKAGASTLMMRAIIGIITGLTTRILVQDSGLGHSDATLVALPIGAGLAVALIYRG